MFSVNTQDETTIGFVDYIPHTENVILRPSETTTSFSILIIDDVVVEGDESFSLTLQPVVQDGSVTLGPTNRMTVIIKDNEQPPGMVITLNYYKLTSANNLLPIHEISLLLSISELLTLFTTQNNSR